MKKPAAGIKKLQNRRTTTNKKTKLQEVLVFCLSSFPLLFIHFMYNDIKLSGEEEGAQRLTTSPLKLVVTRGPG
jgi:hypothetical protein